MRQVRRATCRRAVRAAAAGSLASSTCRHVAGTLVAPREKVQHPQSIPCAFRFRRVFTFVPLSLSFTCSSLTCLRSTVVQVPAAARCSSGPWPSFALQVFTRIKTMDEGRFRGAEKSHIGRQGSAPIVNLVFPFSSHLNSRHLKQKERDAKVPVDGKYHCDVDFRECRHRGHGSREKRRSDQWNGFNTQLALNGKQP